MSSDQMPSSTRFIQRLCHDWENMEMTDYNFLLTKEARKYFAHTILATDTCALVARLKSYISKITQLISTRTPTINKYGVCGHKRMRLHAIHGQVWTKQKLI